MGILLFLINPIIYIIFCFCKRNSLKTKIDKLLFILSFSIIGTYIPYNAGDSFRYAFKYYELRTLPYNEAVISYLPSSDVLYYKVLHFFSYIGFPYSAFVIFINFMSLYILFKLISDSSSILIKEKKIYFILLYMPIMIALSQRFPLSAYIMIYSLYKFSFSRKYRYIFLVVLSVLVHGANVILILIYGLSSIFFYTKKINEKFIVILIIIVGSLFYINLEEIYYFFQNNYLIKKAFNYKLSTFSRYSTNIILISATQFLGNIFSLFIAYKKLIFNNKELKKDGFYYFLIILGAFIIAFINFASIPQRYAWVFNVAYVIFCIKNKIRINFLFKMILYFSSIFQIILILYYGTYYYSKNYNAFPQILYPTIFQMIGYNNKYNEKIEKIALNYDDKKGLGKGINANLSKYYK